MKNDRRIWLGLLCFVTFQVGLSLYKNWQPTKRPNSVSTESLDTFVPLGFSLVPIQIENLAEVQSMVNQFAIVDLYKQGVTKAIASGVRMLRSPRNPDVFAVLIEQHRASELIGTYGAEFIVSLKSPGSQPIKIKKPIKRSITLE